MLFIWPCSSADGLLPVREWVGRVWEERGNGRERGQAIRHQRVVAEEFDLWAYESKG